MPFAAANRSRRNHRSFRPRAPRVRKIAIAAIAPPITTIGTTEPNAAIRKGGPMSPLAADASDPTIDPITVRKTLPNTRKKAMPSTTGMTVAADPNIDGTAPLTRSRRVCSRRALRSIGSVRGRGSNDTDAARALTGCAPSTPWRSRYRRGAPGPSTITPAIRNPTDA